MSLSKNYNKVKNYYDQELWSINKIRNAVNKGWITAEEFEIITGELFSE